MDLTCEKMTICDKNDPICDIDLTKTTTDGEFTVSFNRGGIMIIKEQKLAKTQEAR